MASGSIPVSTGNQYISGYIGWSSSADIANNQSTVSATMYLSRTNSGYTTYGSGSFTLTINGSSYTNSASFTITQNSNTVMVSYSVVVPHNSDGTMAITISGSGNIPSTSMNGASGSGTAVLDTIPRASGIITFDNFNVGSAFTVTADVKNTGFTHLLYFSLGGYTFASRGWSAGTTSASISFSQVEYNNILDYIPSGGIATTVTLTLYTMSGDTVIGTSSKSVTAYAYNSGVATFDNFTIGNNIYVVATGNLPSFGFKYDLKVGSTLIKSNTTGATYNTTTFSITSSDRDAMLNLITAGSNSVTATLYITTLYGSKQIGGVATKNATGSIAVGNITAFSGYNINGTGKTVTMSNVGVGGLTYSLELKIGNTSIATRTSGIVASYSLVLSSAEQTAMYNAMPNVTSVASTLYLTTLYGTKQIGSISAVTATATIDTNVIKPSITSVTAVETQTATGQVGAVVGKFVQTLSRIKMDINGAVASTGATISSYKINFLYTDYAQASYTTGAINSSGTGIVITGTITDSRGLTATKTITIDILPYSFPSLTYFNVDRTDSGGVLSVLGTYATLTTNGSISSLKNASNVEKNILTYKLYSSPRGKNTWTLKKTVTLSTGTLSVTNAKDTIGTGGEYLATASYDYQIYLSDTFNTTISSVTMPSGQVVMSWSKTGIGVGKIIEQGILDVSGDTYIGGKITTTGLATVVGLTSTGDIMVSKNNPWLTLDSSSAGGDGVEQGAGISIGESGYKGGASLHLTYTGDGYGHIGMGAVNTTTGLPQYEAIRLLYTDNTVRILGNTTIGGTATITGITTMSSDLYNSSGIRLGNTSSNFLIGRDATNNMVMLANSNGFVKIGSANTSGLHFYTDRPTYWFDHDVKVQGRLYQGANYNEKVWGSGDIGLGGGGKPIDYSSGNLNTLTGIGFINGSNMVGAPSADWYYGLLQSYSGNNAYSLQIMSNFFYDSIYFRRFDNAVWKPWRRLLWAGGYAYSWTGTIGPDNSVEITHNLGYNPIVRTSGTCGNLQLTTWDRDVNNTTLCNYSSGGNSWYGTILFY